MNDIRSWLQQLGLDQYEQLFMDNGINRQALPHITEQDLQELGVLLGHRRILLAAIADLETQPSITPEPDRAGQAAATAPGEHRQVTILFADLVNYTRLSAELDAEEVHDLLACFLDEVDQVIVEFGGTIDKHLGDCVMGLFGAPVAHSDDPSRALYAALEILARMPTISERAGRSLGVHVGIANGQVVASGVGRDTHYTVTGDSVNLASRLTDAAKAGEVLLSEGVRVAAAEAFEFEEQGGVALKGIDGELRVYRLLSANTGRQVQRAFVGRQAEIQQFTGILKACRETAAGQAVYLRGEAGIGKTRLGNRFEQIAAEQGFSGHRALVLDFGMGREQSVERTLVRSLLAIPADSEIPERQAALDAALDTGLVVSDELVFFNELLGLPQGTELHSLYDAMDARARERGKIEAIVGLLQRRCQQQPQMFLVEDIHWADETVLAFLAALAGALVEQPAVLVMTTRIEGDPFEQGWKRQQLDLPFVTYDLRPLRSEDALALALEYFSGDEEYIRQCVARAAGNPLYLEQLLRNTGQRGGDEVPGSVQSIVQASLDSLDVPDRQAIQAASVLGQRFNLPTLRHVLERDDYEIDALISNNLVRTEGSDFLFAHALVQEAVYQSLLKSRRSQLHVRAADWYGDGDPELRARHLERGADPGAAMAYRQAAQGKLKALHYGAALELAQHGLALARQEAQRCQLLLTISRAQRHLGDTEQGRKSIDEVLELATDNQLRCCARLEQAENLRLSDRQSQALEALEKAQARAEAGDLAPERMRIHYLRGNLAFMTGDIPGCLAEHQRSLALAEQVDSAEGMALALGGLGDADYLRGHMRSARDRFQACIELSREHAFGQIEVANRHMVGWSRIFLLEFDEGLEDALAAVKMANRVGHFRAEMIGAELAGLIEMERGHFEQARQYLERNRELASRLNAGNFVAQAWFMLSRLALAEGDVKLARKHADTALDTVRAVGTAFIGPSVLAACAELSTDPGRQSAYLAEAEAILEAGCVSHNYFHFTRIAIDICLANEDWRALESHASRLKDYTREQPLEWSDFIIARGRALAEWKQGGRSPGLIEALHRLRDQGQEAGFMQPLVAIEQALADGQ